ERSHVVPQLEHVVLGMAATRRDVLLPWLRVAAECCLGGRPPRPAGFPSQTQAAQLALTLAPCRLLLCLCSTEEAPEPGRLFCLARAAEWFASETGAAVCVLVPEKTASSPELDNLSSQALHLADLQGVSE